MARIREKFFIEQL